MGELFGRGGFSITGDRVEAFFGGVREEGKPEGRDCVMDTSMRAAVCGGARPRCALTDVGRTGVGSLLGVVTSWSSAATEGAPFRVLDRAMMSSKERYVAESRITPSLTAASKTRLNEMWIASSRRGDINPETAGRSSSAIPALLLLWPAAAALRLALKY